MSSDPIDTSDKMFSLEVKGDLQVINNLAKVCLDGHNKELNELREQMQQLKAMIPLPHKIHSLVAKINSYEDSNKRLEEEVKQLSSASSQLSSDLSQLQTTNDIQKSEIASLKAEEDNNKRLEDEVKQISSGLSQLSSDLSQLQITNTSLEAEMNRLKANPIPIGFVYVQLAAMPDPKQLWPNTDWENISSEYADLIFRCEGKQSAEFGQIQEQQSPEIEAYTKFFPSYSAPIKWLPHEKWTVLKGNNDPYIWSGDGAKLSGVLALKLRCAPNDEIRPRNSTVRVWKRMEVQ